MRRRDVITLLGGAAAGWPLAARAQQAALPTIGVLYAGSAAEWMDQLAGFRHGLGETGLSEGQNVAVEFRWADDQLDRMPALAADLVGRKVSVILTTSFGIGVVRAASRTIPIVFTTGVDPVAAGIVPSLNRPGANLTGVTRTNVEPLPKRLELLHEVIPTASKLAILINPREPDTLRLATQGVQAAARRLGLDVMSLSVSSEHEIETAFARAVQQRADALIVGNSAFLTGRSEQIGALTLRYALPTMAATRQQVAAGALMTLAADMADMFRQAGIYAGRIVKGENAGDLPVVQPTKFELIVNLKTARAIDLTIPESFLARADEVIE